ncbi:MAG: DNA recombination/repair protein RecA, partial [Firmicutes bacterium]|nr:DNA recombination/repair protein RecA [Bacillota bacterium]
MAKKNTEDSKSTQNSIKDKDEKSKAIDLVIGQIEKNFGKGSIMKLTEVPIVATEVISTGCLSIDIALGIGGLPRGRIVEIYG